MVFPLSPPPYAGLRPCELPDRAQPRRSRYHRAVRRHHGAPSRRPARRRSGLELPGEGRAMKRTPKEIDPITIEIISNALRSIADETFVALMKSAYSTN